MRILLIEDDESLRQTIPFQLRQEGFSVDASRDGEEGLLFIRERVHDLVLLDRMLPGLDGMEVLRRMRREGISTPVIFLTALGQVEDRTQGLNSGADDYIVKPFAFEELLARIRCVLRRPVSLQNDETLSFGDIAYEPRTLTLRRGEQSTVLSKRLGDLLELFLHNPGQDPAKGNHPSAGLGHGLRCGGWQSGQLHLFSPAEPAEGGKPPAACHRPGCGLPIGGAP